MAQLTSDIANYYGYNEFLTDKLFQLFPVSEAIEYSRTMAEITTDFNPNLTIPILGFRGTATGIDVRKVEETGILPVINTAIAHKEAGIGMIGAGLTHPPIDAFHQATLALAEKYR